MFPSVSLAMVVSAGAVQTRGLIGIVGRDVISDGLVGGKKEGDPKTAPLSSIHARPALP